MVARATPLSEKHCCSPLRFVTRDDVWDAIFVNSIITFIQLFHASLTKSMQYSFYGSIINRNGWIYWKLDISWVILYVSTYLTHCSLVKSYGITSFWLTLVQVVMPCLKQCWLSSIEVMAVFREIRNIYIYIIDMRFKIINWIMQPHIPVAIELKRM